MVNGDADCPYCNDRMVAPGYNTLAAKFPDIAALWSDKNELSADEVLPNTNFADWDCPDCHMTFHARIIDMVNGNDNCPYCSGRKAIPGKTSFAALHPDLIEECNNFSNHSKRIEPTRFDPLLYLLIIGSSNHFFSEESL